MIAGVTILCSYQLWARPPEKGIDHLLEGHLQRVANRSNNFIKDLFKHSIDFHELGFEEDDLLKLITIIGATHDVGKATTYFQEYLRDRHKKINPELKAHSPLSSLYCYYSVIECTDIQHADRPMLGYFGSLPVLGHHTRLLSLLDAANKLRCWKGKLKEQILDIRNSHNEEIEKILNKLGLPAFENFDLEGTFKKFKNNNDIIKRIKGKGLASYYLVNLLFSALLDADRLDAAGLTTPSLTNVANVEIIQQYINTIKNKEGVSPHILSMREKLFKQISEKVNSIDLNKRIYSLTAPTGSGKTISSIYFALTLRDRLIREGKQQPRIIYVAPFLSILDQNFKVLQDALKCEGQSNVLLEHHHLSELSFKVENDFDEQYSTLGSELMIEGWNAELIVTTFVQFLHTILGSRPSQLRKLHNLVGSIVILDEVQTIPYKWWGLIRKVLTYLSEKLQMFFILMTATQPLIFNEEEIVEIVDNNEEYFKIRNYQFEIDYNKSVELDEFINIIATFINQHTNESIMIVMNTINSATKLFDTITNENHLIEDKRAFEYLSSELLPYHRTERLKSLYSRLEAKEPLILITTQVVEAGVDIDFNYVVRDIGPIDSIIQVAGRCNRNGLRYPEESVVRVLEVLDNGRSLSKTIYGEFAIDKTKESLACWKQEEGIKKLAQIYYRKTREGMSNNESEEMLNALYALKYNKLDEFKVIEDDEPSIPLFIEINEEARRVWEKYENIYEDKQSEPKERREKFLKMRDHFYRYVINIPLQYAEGIPEKYGFLYIENSVVPSYYDYKTGFKRRRFTAEII